MPSLPGNLPPEIFKIVLGKIDDLATALCLIYVNKEVAKWTKMEIYEKLTELELFFNGRVAKINGNSVNPANFWKIVGGSWR